MDEIKELLAKRQAALDAAKAIMAAAKTAGEDLTDEQLAEVEAHAETARQCQEDVATIQAKAAKVSAVASALDAAEKWGNASRPQQTAPSDPTAGCQPSGNPSRSPGVASTSTSEHSFPTFGDRLVAVIAASKQHPSQWDPRLLAPMGAASGSNESVGSEGGFLVGSDESQELLQLMYASNQILQGGPGYSGPTRIPISSNSNSVKLKALAQTNRADGSRWGGIQASWVEEAATKPDTKPTFRTMELSLKKLVGLYYATDELLQDASALEALVMNWFAQEFAFKVQDALVNGTGAGMPAGILNANCLVTQAKETGQAAATITKENIDKMWSRMWTPGLGNSVWHINQQCYPALFNMEQSIGTGGLPVFLPPGGLSVSPYGTLTGRPIVPLEQCQALGTLGDICFCDWSQMLFADKGGMQTASSIHVKFINDETTFRFVYRCDGQPSWASPVTPFKGGSTATTGPFIALAARS